MLLCLAAASAGLTWLWLAAPIALEQLLHRFATQNGVRYTKPTAAPTDIFKGITLVLLLAFAETSEGERLWALPITLMAWFAMISLPRMPHDPLIQTTLGVQCAAVCVSWMLSPNGLWWACLLVGVLVALARRVGLPPCPILIAHLLPIPTRFSPGAGWTEFPVKTADGFNLYSLKYEVAGATRWTILFNGNAMLVQNGTTTAAAQFAQAVKTNVVVFNFRGCAGSEGLPRTCHDLVTDGEAVLDAVVACAEIDQSKVLLHGISLGGCVATLVRANPRFRSGPILVDRSFSTLMDAALHISGHQVENLLGRVAPWVCQLLVLPLAELAGWNFSPCESIGSITGPKLLVDHELDLILPPGCQSHEKTKLGQNDLRVQLTTTSWGPTPQHSYHCYSITADPQWSKIKTKLDTMF